MIGGEGDQKCPTIMSKHEIGQWQAVLHTLNKKHPPHWACFSCSDVEDVLVVLQMCWRGMGHVDGEGEVLEGRQ